MPHGPVTPEAVVWKRSRQREPAGRYSNGEPQPTHTMNTLEIKGDWNITKGKLKQKWAQLTDDDLQYVDGQMEELYGRIQKRTGQTREAVEKAIKESTKGCGCN